MFRVGGLRFHISVSDTGKEVAFVYAASKLYIWESSSDFFLNPHEKTVNGTWSGVNTVDKIPIPIMGTKEAQISTSFQNDTVGFSS